MPVNTAPLEIPRTSLASRTETILAWMACALGGAQAFIAPFAFFSEASEPAFWFAHGGLALAFLGALNLVRRRAPSLPLDRLTIGVNFTSSAFWVVMSVVLSEKFLRHKPSFTGVVVVVLLALLSLRRDARAK